jgi:hypothetical protein
VNTVHVTEFIRPIQQLNSLIACPRGGFFIRRDSLLLSITYPLYGVASAREERVKSSLFCFPCQRFPGFEQQDFRFLEQLRTLFADLEMERNPWNSINGRETNLDDS